MLKLFFNQTLGLLGQWVVSYLPFPNTIEQRAIQLTLQYLDQLITQGNPNFWAEAESYLIDQLGDIAENPKRYQQILSHVRSRFDPKILSGLDK